jgi:hypothetical protein
MRILNMESKVLIKGERINSIILQNLDIGGFLQLIIRLIPNLFLCN